MVLTEERWAHIADDQPGFKPRPGAVLPGDPSSFGVAETAVDFDESPEGHHARYDSAGTLVGITIVNARHIVADDGVIAVTLPDRRVKKVRDLGDVLTAA